ncbi:phosphotransferase [Streptomyces sp. CA-249302]|uniref:phosphotransferase n=1 Tax=Streptomyces sp. CA-249302 TaxID=3240058 RepID=UPI003D8FECC3
MGTTGRLLGSGRTCDVYEYEIDGTWVLRRNREGWGDALAEGRVMEHVRAHGCPVPRVRLADSTRTELVMERVAGVTMLEAFGAGTLGVREGGEILAGLLRQLHGIPGRHSSGRILHLDLHPDNVMLTPDGQPVVIDWSNAEEGHPGLDWAMSAVILAQVAVDDGPLAHLSDLAHAGLAALLADPSQLTEEGLAEARNRRSRNPTMSTREVELLGDAEELIRTYWRG